MRYRDYIQGMNGLPKGVTPAPRGAPTYSDFLMSVLPMALEQAGNVQNPPSAAVMSGTDPSQPLGAPNETALSRIPWGYAYEPVTDQQQAQLVPPQNPYGNLPQGPVGMPPGQGPYRNLPDPSRGQSGMVPGTAGRAGLGLGRDLVDRMTPVVNDTQNAMAQANRAASRGIGNMVSAYAHADDRVAGGISDFVHQTQAERNAPNTTIQQLAREAKPNYASRPTYRPTPSKETYASRPTYQPQPTPRPASPPMRAPGPAARSNLQEGLHARGSYLDLMRKGRLG